MDHLCLQAAVCNLCDTGIMSVSRQHWELLQAREKGRMGTSQIAHYDLDRLGVQAALHLPTADSNAVKSGSIDQMQTFHQTFQDNMPDMPDDVKQRLASLLAAEFSKKACAHLCSLVIVLWQLPAE